MPELPDVEGFRRVFAEHAAGARVRDVDVLDAQVLRGVAPARLRSVVRGRRFGEPARHGKWLIAPVAGDGEALLLHFGMTGSLVWDGEDRPRHRHDRVVFTFAEGELRYRDMRKLTGLRLARDETESRAALGDLGPDALSVSRDELGRLLGGLRRRTKSALTDQSVLAGLGNLLADEILWRAKLSPHRAAAGLSRGDLGRLHARMGTVLRQSVEAGRVPPRPSWLTGRRDEPSASCPRCGTTLCRGRVDGRSTVWCPRCQPT
ncbi:Fpg/Nei family DNA glycosylase [Prauserella muralis]|uniref:Formamidopyrimidine-DNA glycosylase n=1 Tax=Prauserella muralis TaxID=588067 RepID=A0A2V4AKX7_9PSEU|nr:DNA-formamidopyrimidine glycosylase family protein [Prauserella muralis]PXY19503.1 formamidopyrimidine-DNA glycosylase [Prauserella muralis]TWE29483.1 formamidopyrimidine-DNA glycosylase [Prauserella muralis]